MLLIDSLYINNSGGKVLLDYLVSELETRNIKPYYLFDLRCINDFKEIPDERKVFLKANLWNRHRWYKENFDKFSSVFCFGNIPPPIRLRIPVYTYFHQLYYLRKIYPNYLKGKIKIFFQKRILSYLCKNTNIVMTQSEFIKNEFEKTYHFPPNRILVMPFFYIPPPTNIHQIKNKNSFVYVSGGNRHKNHFRLLKAWELLAKEGYYPELGLTVDKFLFPKIDCEIKKLQQNGLKIFNYGFTNPYSLYDKYEYLIFPSLLETMGLGQVEAICCGCKVIASDLPHTFAVIQPSLIFNPLDENSIKNAVVEALQSKKIPESKVVMQNKINELIQLIK